MTAPLGIHDLQVESIAHGVLDLISQSPDYGILRRQLNVGKSAAPEFREGYHDLNIETGGMVLFPASSLPNITRISTGRCIPAMSPNWTHCSAAGSIAVPDNMFMGPPGVGKSTLAIKFMHAAASGASAPTYLIFDETLGTFLHRAT